MHYIHIHTRNYRHMAVFGTTLIEPDYGYILIIRAILRDFTKKNNNLLLKLQQLTGQVKLK